MKIVIWWIRRDIRLHDNQALAQALKISSIIIPLYIFDPYLLKRNPAARKSFLNNALESFNCDLHKHGFSLILREGDPLIELQKVFIEANAEKIFAEADYSPYAKKRDLEAAEILPCEFVSGLTIHPPFAVRKPDGSPYTVFTHYKNAWKSLPESGKPLNYSFSNSSSIILESMKIHSENTQKYFPASETEAKIRLENFSSSHLTSYSKYRDHLNTSGTSGLSPYLRFGLISARTMAFRAKEFIHQSQNIEERKSAEIWFDELIWRDFFYSIMENFPFVLSRAFRENLRLIPWRKSDHDLEAWRNGLTGYPVVDAGMRQLLEMGWMHNRARMITASFLTKDLLINWQEGEAWFMKQLIDGDPACNNGGWQWCAGTGTDSSPYFRIFNPVLQGKKFDAAGDYIRRWIPELSDVPKEYIHSPWEMPTDLQSKISVIIGKTYPKPIVNHSEARERALAAYRISKNN